MNWKDQPRWLKFGIIFSAVSLILELIDYLVAAIACSKLPSDGSVACMFPLKILELPVQSWVSGSAIIIVLMTVIFYLVVGALIGLIVDKIKSKK
jgi:hypothetical protein